MQRRGRLALAPFAFKLGFDDIEPFVDVAFVIGIPQPVPKLIRPVPGLDRVDYPGDVPREPAEDLKAVIGGLPAWTKDRDSIHAHCGPPEEAPGDGNDTIARRARATNLKN
jgi:hypothetical protein